MIVFFNFPDIWPSSDQWDAGDCCWVKWGGTFQKPFAFLIQGTDKARVVHPLCFPLTIGTLGFPDSTRGKEPTCQYMRQKRHEFDSWVGKIPWRRAWQPTPVFLAGESPGWRSLAGYSPQGCRVKHDWSGLACTHRNTRQLFWGLEGADQYLEARCGGQRKRARTSDDATELLHMCWAADPQPPRVH